MKRYAFRVVVALTGSNRGGNPGSRHVFTADLLPALKGEAFEIVRVVASLALDRLQSAHALHRSRSALSEYFLVVE